MCASAAPVGLFLTNSVPTSPVNRVVNRLAINSTSNVQLLQMIVSLTSGSIRQDPNGGDTPPVPPVVIAVVIDPEFPPQPPIVDTFVAMGSFTGSSTQIVQIIGPAVGIPGTAGSVHTMSTSRIDIAWAPSTGLLTGPVTNFPIAQMVLSNDAFGTASFLLSSAGEPGSVFSVPIINGVIVPEPASAALGLLALCGLGTARRH
jgi:hypothetical protein